MYKNAVKIGARIINGNEKKKKNKKITSRARFISSTAQHSRLFFVVGYWFINFALDHQRKKLPFDMASLEC